MAAPFRRTRKGITGALERPERELLIKLFQDVMTTLEPEPAAEQDPLEAMLGISGDGSAPQDPALARLLPQAADDPEQAAEFRRYTEQQVREGKVANLKMAAMDCESAKPVLDERHAMALAAALNDVRLVLAVRLEIQDEQDAERVASFTDWSQATDVDSYMALVYQFVSWLQDSLMEALMEGLQDS